MNIIYKNDYGFNIPFVMAFTLVDATDVKLSIHRPDGTTVNRTLASGDYAGVGLNDTLEVATIDGDFDVAGYCYAQIHVTKAGVEILSDKVLFAVKNKNTFT